MKAGKESDRNERGPRSKAKRERNLLENDQVEKETRLKTTEISDKD